MTDKLEKMIVDDILDEDNNPDVEKPKKKSKKEENENVIFTSLYEDNEFILEQISSHNNNNNIYNTTHTTHTTHNVSGEYALFDKSTASVTYIDSFLANGKEYRPIVGNITDQNIVCLPNGVLEYGETSDLIKEIKEFLYEYFEVPNFFQNFLPCLVLFYWVYQRFPFIPYLQFLGRSGTGKSTAMETVGAICYKAIDVSGAISPASLFRIAAQWRGTLLLDEFNAGGDNYQEMLAILKSGVSARAVLRTEGEGKKEVQAYVMKSPKMFTSEKPVTDAGLRSRIIEIQMEQNRRRVPLYKQARFYQKSQELRNKLLMWRFNNLNKVDLSEVEFGYKELAMFQGRVQHVLTPIYYLSDEATRKEIVEFASQQQAETLKERRDSLEGQAFEAIYEYYQRGQEPSLSAITEAINKSSKYPITERKLGSIIRKMLGFKIERRGDKNISTVVLDKQEDTIQLHCDYYGISYAQRSSVVRVVSGVDDSDPFGSSEEENTEEGQQTLLDAENIFNAKLSSKS